jgi:hypothetical protein
MALCLINLTQGQRYFYNSSRTDVVLYQLIIAISFTGSLTDVMASEVEPRNIRKMKGFCSAAAILMDI